jgi:F-type H+-transporting ATPase subunit b
MEAILENLNIKGPELLVNIVGFVLLVWLLKRYMFGPVGDFLEQRRQRIAQDLADAEGAKQDAASELASLQARRADMLAAAEKEAADQKAAAFAEAGAIKDKARTEAGNTVRQAESEIARKTEEALASLRGETATLAVGMCEKLLRTSLNSERHTALIDQFIEDIERSASSQGA